MKCYIAGKISGLHEFVYKANFERSKKTIIELGYDPVSPIDLPHNHDKTWLSYMKECIPELLKCDAVYAQSNWWESPGAAVEVKLAEGLGLKVIFEEED